MLLFTVIFWHTKNHRRVDWPEPKLEWGEEIGVNDIQDQDVLIESTMGTHGGVITHIAPCFMVSGSKEKSIL